MKMRRLTAYVAGSMALATGVLGYAALERPNFYSAAVYLSQSNACLMIMCNMALVLAGSLMYGLQQLLFGPLRPLEIEQLWEKGWFALMEWIFAMSTFRDEFGVWFLVMFMSLFTGKIWGWIAEGRVDHLEQQAPNDPRLFHGRLVASLTIYVLFAIQMFVYSLDIVLFEARPGMTIMFVFEFAILCISAMATCLRYVIWIQEHRITRAQIVQAVQARKEEIRKQRKEAEERQAANPEAADELANLPKEEDVDENEIEALGWEAKRGWLFALDIISDLLKLVSYMAFFTILTVFYGIPIYIIRDLYMTMRSFTKRVSDYLRFQAATKDMDTRYPNATAEDLAAENTCIVCREEMQPYEVPRPTGGVPQNTQTMLQRQKPKKLPCGHILHFGCLSSWLERQQSCPICRRSVFTQPQGQTQNTPAQAAGGNAPGQHPAVGANHQRQNNQPANHRNQGRVFRLGPIQLQFGGRAGRADDQEIMNILGRLAQNRARNPQHAQNPPSAAIVATNEQGAQHIAAAGQADAVIEPTLDPANSQVHPGIRSAAARMALNTVEDQIRLEIQALTQQSQRANALRNTLNELDRARGIAVMPVQQPQNQYAIEPIGALPQGIGFPITPSHYRPESFNRHQSTYPVGRLSPGAAEASNTNRPSGLVIPPGWTLVPINPIHDQNGAVPNQAFSAQATPIQQSNALLPPRVGLAANTAFPNPLAQLLESSMNNRAMTPGTPPQPTPTPTTQDRSTPAGTNGNSTSRAPDTATEAESSARQEEVAQAGSHPPTTTTPTWSFPSLAVGTDQSADGPQSDQSSEPVQANGKAKAPSATLSPTPGAETSGQGAQEELQDKQPQVEDAEDE